MVYPLAGGSDHERAAPSGQIVSWNCCNKDQDCVNIENFFLFISWVLSCVLTPPPPDCDCLSKQAGVTALCSSSTINNNKLCLLQL